MEHNIDDGDVHCSPKYSDATTKALDPRRMRRSRQFWRQRTGTHSYRTYSHDIRLVVDHRLTKARLCARVGIDDYWVLHLEDRRLIVHRDPAGDGFRLILAYDEHEYVSTLAAPSTGVLFGEFLKYQRLPRGEMGHT